MATNATIFGCRTRVIEQLDGHAGRHGIVNAHTPLSAKLGNLGIGTQECAILEDYVNRERAARGLGPVAAGSIKVGTTIGEVMTSACG